MRPLEQASLVSSERAVFAGETTLLEMTIHFVRLGYVRMLQYLSRRKIWTSGLITELHSA